VPSIPLVSRDIGRILRRHLNIKTESTAAVSRIPNRVACNGQGAALALAGTVGFIRGDVIEITLLIPYVFVNGTTEIVVRIKDFVIIDLADEIIGIV